MSRRHRTFAFLTLLCLNATACIAWSPVTVTPQVLLQQPEPPERIRVTHQDGMQLVLLRPTIRAGALVATAAPGAMLVSDVQLLEVEKVSVLRTIGVLTPSILLVAVIGKAACRC